MSELVVVMPVYNEAEIVGKVVRDWLHALRAHGIDFEIHAYDDGSTDETAKILGELARSAEGLYVHVEENRGHGPTILEGYRAARDAEWIFQVDSDDEMEAAHFAELWRRRGDFDLLIGSRRREGQPWSRRILSAGSRLALRLLFGSRVGDVNAPYRLMRACTFRPFFASLPHDTFAPNVILSGCASTHDLRVFETPVPQRPRRTGQVSIRGGKLVRVAARSLLQTLRYRFGLSSDQSPRR